MKKDGTEWAAWFGGEQESRRILGASRGRAKVYFLAGDNDNPKAGEAAGRTCADSFLRRPSVKPVAMSTIAGFINQAVLATARPDPEYRFDAAALYLFRDETAWVVSGCASVLIFSDGKLWKQSEAKEYPFWGMTPRYEAEPSPACALPEGASERIAVFLCTGLLPDRLDTGLLEKTLAGVSAPGEWLSHIMPQIAPEESALAAFLPGKRPVFGFLK